MGLHRTLGETKTEPFCLCRLPVSCVCPLWSSRQGEATKMLASFENEDHAIKADDFRISRCGERNGASRGYGSFCVLQRFSHGILENILFSMKAWSVIDCCFLLGRENTPVLAYITLFSAFVLVQSAPDISFLFFLLTNSISLCHSCPKVFRDLWEALTGEMVTSESIYEGIQIPRDKGEGTWGFHDRDRDCRSSCFFWPAQAALLSIAETVTYWLLRSVFKKHLELGN